MLYAKLSRNRIDQIIEDKLSKRRKKEKREPGFFPTLEEVAEEIAEDVAKILKKHGILSYMLSAEEEATALQIIEDDMYRTLKKISKRER